jgi:hypothetical protein
MDKLSDDEIEMLLQVAEKESRTFSKLYKETLEKANSRSPEPLEDYQSLYDQIDEVTTAVDIALSGFNEYCIFESAGSLFRSTLAQQVSIVEKDIDHRSSVEEVANALRCLADMALMLGKEHFNSLRSDGWRPTVYVETLCTLKEGMEEMGTMLRDKGVTIDNDLQEKIRELDDVYALPEFDHIPTIFWAEARGKRMLDERRSKQKGEKRKSGEILSAGKCERCDRSIWGFPRVCHMCGPCESDTYGLTTEEVLIKNLENLDFGNPRKRLRSD